MNVDYSRHPRVRSAPSTMAAHLPPGKREADQLLVLLLRQNGCSVPKGVSSVGDLTSDAVIEAVGSMIPGIDGSPPLPSAFSTRGLHPAERFNTSTAVASRVRDAGFSEPLSAHQLLYPAEEDTRQLLLALLSMLPPEGAPSPPPTPTSSAGETPLLSGTGETDQPGDLLSSDLPHKEEAVTGGERKGGLVVSSSPKGSGEQDVAVEAGGERVGGGEYEGDGTRVNEDVAEEEGLEGKASGRGTEGSRDAEGSPREPRGEQEHEAVSGGGDGAGERGEEEEEQGVGTPTQGHPLSVERPHQEGGDFGSASEGDGVESVVDKEAALVAVERLEGDVGGHEDRPASAPLLAHEGEPDLEDAASKTVGGGGAVTDKEKGRSSAVAAEDKREEADGGLLLRASPTREDDNGRKRASVDDGSPSSADAGGAGLGVPSPQGEGGAPDDGAGEGAARSEGHASEAGGGPGGREEGGGAEGGGAGGAVPAPEALGDEGVEEDVVFLQFEVDAQEVELERLLKEDKIHSDAADELEEEVRRLGTLAEEREKHCRHATKALELLPNAAGETVKLQNQCTAAETRMQAARKAFDKTRRPLEDVVRVQREDLARRKARCRALLTDMRSIYAQCEEMTRQESLLRVAAIDMEACERRDRGEIVVGDEAGEESDGAEWGREDEVDEEAARRRKAGALLRTDIDLRISGLCEDAMAQKQEIAISLSEVLDSRREANSAWELLGRSEALSEERLFTAAKEAKSGGGANKDRAKDLIDAYKCLHLLDDLFSNLVEAVSEVGKREEEYRVVERETDRLLRWQGGTARFELLSRDLQRVKGDAFALEQRLDQALEEERLKQKNSQEARELEGEELQQAQLEGNAGREGRFSGEGAGMGEEHREEEEANKRWDDVPIRARHEDVEEAHRQVLEEEVRRDEEGEARLSERDDARVGSFEEDDVPATVSVSDEVDFVGEDDEENVWQ